MKKITATCLILVCCALPFAASAESDGSNLSLEDKLISEISSKTS